MSLQDKETAHLKINPDKYKEGYDRIFNNRKGSLEENSEISERIDKAETIHLVKHCHNQEKRIEELENLLNESQTARFGLTLQVTELRKKLGETFNNSI